ncbi:hypothetical protein PIB30_095242, partial [Stylosanthes scabra]|nr:hypothetical protein [Stylosanthes scabra]
KTGGSDHRETELRTWRSNGWSCCHCPPLPIIFLTADVVAAIVVGVVGAADVVDEDPPRHCRRHELRHRRCCMLKENWRRIKAQKGVAAAGAQLMHVAGVVVVVVACVLEAHRNGDQHYRRRLW